MLFVSVPNYSVHKFNKDYYSVALTNGNIGAGLIHKDDFDKFIKDHNGKDYRKTVKKIAVGTAAVGLVTAGILLRKPLAETAKKVFEKVKNSEFVGKASKFVKESLGKAKTFAIDAFKSIKNCAKELMQKLKISDTILDNGNPFQGIH